MKEIGEKNSLAPPDWVPPSRCDDDDDDDGDDDGSDNCDIEDGTNVLLKCTGSWSYL